ncbi:hypothetical protein A2964_03275 [Candidatus Daviesbacteria bacterium RIFCSPLOWO2_01_FULL_40_27]|nr:MAG: hypothetical protein A2964_03275 [Candidatus Daviesbacteria bacterium RIFCSPLOWO2_01_FULL_40_27]
MPTQKGFMQIIFILGIIIVSVGIIGGSFYIKNNLSKVNNINNVQLTPSPSPYGSQEPSLAPSPTSLNTSRGGNCTDDSQCTSGYKCQVLEGEGTVCPEGTNKVSTGTFTLPEASCQPTTKIIKGQCKLTEGGSCQTDNDCYSGLVCHRNICTNPISKVSCSEPSDNSCPDGYKCVQACGPPVAREGDKPPGYFCEVEELANKPRNCPICLASNTQIATPTGDVNVKDLKVGMKVYSVNEQGKKIVVDIIKVSSTQAPASHRVVHLTLSDGRELWVSPNHPTIDGLEAGQLQVGQNYDGSIILSSELIPYWDNKTYDLLPNSETGFYFANSILMGSTLKQ